MYTVDYTSLNNISIVLFTFFIRCGKHGAHAAVFFTLAAVCISTRMENRIAHRRNVKRRKTKKRYIRIDLMNLWKFNFQSIAECRWYSVDSNGIVFFLQPINIWLCNCVRYNIFEVQYCDQNSFMLKRLNEMRPK